MSHRQRTQVPGMCSWPVSTPVTRRAVLWLCADPRPQVYLLISCERRDLVFPPVLCSPATHLALEAVEQLPGQS